MSVIEHSLSINKNALNREVPNPVNNPLIIGYASGVSSGDLLKFKTITEANYSTLVSGQGKEWVSMCLNAGLTTVDFLPVSIDSTNVASKSIFKNTGNLKGSSVGTQVPTLGGDAVDDYLIRVEVIYYASASVTFRYSLDNGDTWVKTKTVATGVTATTLYLDNAETVSSGLTVTFGTGTYVEGDVWSAFAFAGALKSSNFTGTNNIFDLIYANGKKYSHIVIASCVHKNIPSSTPMTGPQADGSNLDAQQVYLGYINTGINALLTKGFPTVALVETPKRMPALVASNAFLDDNDSDYQAAIDTKITTYNDSIVISAGRILRATDKGNRVWRSKTYAALERIIMDNSLLSTIYTDRPIPVEKPSSNILYGLIDLTSCMALGCTLDESRSSNQWGGTFGALTNRGFLCAYTSSFAPSNKTFQFLASNTRTDQSNDFFDYFYKAQFNALQKVIATELYKYRGQNLIIKQDGTGSLTDGQALVIEKAVQAKIKEQLISRNHLVAPPTINDMHITINRAWNVASSNELRYTFRMWVGATVKTFSGRGSITLG